MMNKKLTMREFIMLAILLIFAAYYFLFYTPMHNAIDDMENQQMEVESELDIASVHYQDLAKMKNELEKFHDEGATGTAIPEYNNIDKVLLELNTIMSGTNYYDITFEDATASNSIARRVFTITYSTDSYDEAVAKVREIESSENRYLITNFNTERSGSSTNEVIVALGGGQVEYVTGMEITCFEFINPDGDQVPVNEDEEENSDGSGDSEDSDSSDE